MQDFKIRRTVVAKLLDEVRLKLAERVRPEDIEEFLSEQYNIDPLQKCTGEAHSNPYIDNCGRCAPRWGWVGDQIKVT